MKTKYIATYDCGYCGCEEIVYLEAESEEQVEKYMKKGLSDYASNYEYLISDQIEDLDDDEDGEVDFYDTQEYEDYYSGCTFYYSIATEEELEVLKEDGVEWLDLTEW